MSPSAPKFSTSVAHWLGIGSPFRTTEFDFPHSLHAGVAQVEERRASAVSIDGGAPPARPRPFFFGGVVQWEDRRFATGKRGFNSLLFHQFRQGGRCGQGASLKSWTSTFDSCPWRQGLGDRSSPSPATSSYAGVVQRIRIPGTNRETGGSSPSARTIFGPSSNGQGAALRRLEFRFDPGRAGHRFLERRPTGEVPSCLPGVGEFDPRQANQIL